MTIFEKASAAIQSDPTLTDLRENCIYWCDGDKYATVNVSSRSRYATRIRNLAEKHPEEAHILSDKPGGYMVAVIPLKAVKLNIVTREMSDEQKEAMVERLRLSRTPAKQ